MISAFPSSHGRRPRVFREQGVRRFQPGVEDGGGSRFGLIFMFFLFCLSRRRSAAHNDFDAR
jgi:hypothetical protein